MEAPEEVAGVGDVEVHRRKADEVAAVDRDVADARQHLVQLDQERARVDLRLRRAVLEELVDGALGEPRADRLGAVALAVLAPRNQRRDRPRAQRGVAGDGHVGRVAEAELGGVGVDLDHPGRLEQSPGGGGEAVEAGAEGDDAVGFGEQVAGGLVREAADDAEVERVPGEQRLAEQRGAEDGAGAVGQLDQGVGGAAEVSAAPADHDDPVGGGDQIGGRGDALGVGLDRRRHDQLLAGAGRRGGRDLALHEGDRQREDGDTATARGGQRPLEQVDDLLTVLGAEGRDTQRGDGGDLVHRLEVERRRRHRSLDQRAVAGDHQQRRAGAVGAGQRPQCVQQAGPAGDDREADLSGRPGEAVGHRHGAALLAGRAVGDAAADQRGRQPGGVLAHQPEALGEAGVEQARGDLAVAEGRVRGGHISHGLSPFPQAGR